MGKAREEMDGSRTQLYAILNVVDSSKRCFAGLSTFAAFKRTLLRRMICDARALRSQRLQIRQQAIEFPLHHGVAFADVPFET